MRLIHHINCIFGRCVVALTTIMAASLDSTADTPPTDYPTITINGTIRARGEYSTASDLTKFSVRTGRVSVSGSATRYVTYRAELDLCDRGKVKVTDVWARLALGRGFAIQAGQMRMPFTYGSARGPHVYLFADRPFVDRQLIGPRNAGIKGIYNSQKAPVTVEAGVFNATALTDHTVWQHGLAYACKALVTLDHLTLITGVESIKPNDVRSTLVNAGVTLHAGRWMVEGEYVNKHYCGGNFDATHGYNLMADYAMPIKLREFNRLSFQGRWDGLTNNSSGVTDDTGRISVTDHARNRLTGGVTMSSIMQRSKVDIKLNYQHCIYRHRFHPEPADGNMVIAELVIRF